MKSGNARRPWYYRLVLAGACLVLIGLLTWVTVRGETFQNRLIQTQKQFISAKNELIGIEQQLQRARQTELLLLAGTGRVDAQKIEKDLASIISSAKRLRNDLRATRMVDPLVRLEKITERYRDSVGESLSERQVLGIPGQPGLLSVLRSREERITGALARINDPLLDAAFLRLSLDERNFAESLDMKLATTLKQQCIGLKERIVARNMQSGLKSELVDELQRFEMDMGKITRSLLALELWQAHNTLQFERLLPNLAQTQKMLDEKIDVTTESMSELRRSLVSKIIFIFSGFLVLFGAFAYMEFRGSRELVRRLGQLAQGMSQLGQGQFRSVPLPSGDDEVGVLASTFSTMAERIRQQIATIDQERENAEIANRAKDAFLANMSHEIRTPMNGVLGMLELMEQTPLSKKQRAYASTLRHSGEALMVILNDILDYSKIEAGMLDLDQRVFSLYQHAQEVVRLFLPEATRKGLRLTLAIDPRSPDWVEGDPHRLRQILTNLLGNACKFTEKGGIGLSIHHEDSSQEMVTIVFTFDDSGIGMDPETLDRIFHPFVQADASTTRYHGGTGLGLAICRMLAERMGGSIRAESELGSGSRFFFRVPFKIGTEKVAGSQPVEVAKKLNWEGLPPMSILVVEDNAVNRILAIEILQSLGFKADIAVDGEDAVRQASKKEYDLILMDIQMPRLDGFQATARILESVEIGRGPVIVAMTASAYKKDRDECLAHGMHDFLCKPFSIEDFSTVMDRWSAVIYEDIQSRG